MTDNSDIRDRKNKPALERLLKMSDLEEILQMKKSAIYQLIQEGKIPKPIKIGGSSRWEQGDIQQAIGMFKRGLSAIKDHPRQEAFICCEQPVGE